MWLIEYKTKRLNGNFFGFSFRQQLWIRIRISSDTGLILGLYRPEIWAVPLVEPAGLARNTAFLDL